MMSTIWILACILTTLVFTTNGVHGKQRCYVCIPNTGMVISEIVKLFPSGPEIPLCNKFKKGKKEFMRDCPDDEDYKGCIHERNGTHVAKTCTTVDVDDCKSANGIEYCYCTGHLCNTENVPAEDPRPAKEVPRDSSEGQERPPSSATDDEDIDEGSGTGEGRSSAESHRPRLPTEEENILSGREDAPAKSQVLPPQVHGSSPKTLPIKIVTLMATVAVVIASV